MTFIDDNVGEVHAAPSITDPTFHRGEDHAAPFSGWFSRPLRVASYSWSEGTQLAEGFNPWMKYFSNPEVYSKIKGFSRLRCKLHVKLLINASPFQYSLGVMSYRPLAGNTSIPAFSGGELDDYYNINNSFSSLMSYTQMPHAHFEPQYSKGCEMELPFIYHMDWLPLESSDLAHLKEMGRLSIASYEVLRTAAAVTSANPINVSVYVWASEVELAGPSMSLQSKDEYSYRPVSTTASAIASAAHSLESVPAIAPFARATGVMASSLGNMAALFGFSNPPVIDPVHSMRINYAANLASTDIPTQIEKLSLDPKNELCVDSRTIGLDGVDHMSIRHIMDRDIFFTNFRWEATDVVDTVLFQTYVNPAVSVVSAYIGASTKCMCSSVQMVPAAMLGTMFENWKGPITFKFVVAASQFHRGRLRITYDPAGPWSNSVSGSMRLYQKIWDLSISNTFEFEVPYMAVAAYLKTYDACVTQDNPALVPPESSFWAPRGMNVRPTYNSQYFNGAFRVDVMNELTAPAPIGVPIFVYVNTKDVEFANPTSGASMSQISMVKLQSEDVMIVADEITHETIPIVDNVDNLPHVYMGEKVVSLRNILHRSAYWDNIRPSFLGSTANPGYDPLATGATMKNALVRWILPRLPMPFSVMRTENASGLPTQGTYDGTPPWSSFNTTIAGFPSNTNYGCNARTTPLALITSCYTGWRGSVVWRAFINQNFSPQPNSSVSTHLDSLHIDRDQVSCDVQRPLDNSGIGGAFYSKFNVLQTGGVAEALAQISPGTTASTLISYLNNDYESLGVTVRNQFSGVSKATPDHVPTVDAILPHYSPNRMLSGNPQYYFPVASGYSIPTTGAYNNLDTFSINARYASYNNGSTAASLLFAPDISLYNHAGVDFTCFNFLAVPTVYVYNAKPALATTFTTPSLFNNTGA